MRTFQAHRLSNIPFAEFQAEMFRLARQAGADALLIEQAGESPEAVENVPEHVQEVPTGYEKDIVAGHTLLIPTLFTSRDDLLELAEIMRAAFTAYGDGCTILQVGSVDGTHAVLSSDYGQTYVITSEEHTTAFAKNIEGKPVKAMYRPNVAEALRETEPVQPDGVVAIGAVEQTAGELFRHLKPEVPTAVITRRDSDFIRMCQDTPQIDIQTVDAVHFSAAMVTPHYDTAATND